MSDGPLAPPDPETVRAGRRPERTIYEITDAGLRELADWLSELVAAPVKEYLQFEAALSLLPALPPEEALAALRQRCQTLEIEIATLDGAVSAARSHGMPRLFALESEYVQALRRAELDYVQRLVKDPLVKLQPAQLPIKITRCNSSAHRKEPRQ